MKIYKNDELKEGMKVKLRSFKTADKVLEFSNQHGGLSSSICTDMMKYFGKTITISELGIYNDVHIFYIQGDEHYFIYDTCWIEELVTNKVVIKDPSSSCPHSDVRRVYVGEWIDVCHVCKQEIK